MSKVMLRPISTYSLAEVQEVTGAALVGIVALSRALNVDVAPINSLYKTGTIKTSYMKMNTRIQAVRICK